MSSENSFLSRWARRKQAVKAAESSPPEAPAAEPVRDAGTESAEAPPRVPEDAGPEPLPSIDDLTAASDISAFLRKGVPEALRQAALRKAWALDPAIRDYIGPADYAWDYNDPGSIPGFGGSIKSAALDKLASLTASGEPPPPPPAAPAAPPPSGSVRLSQAAQPAAEADTTPDPDPAPAPQKDSPPAEPSSGEAPPDLPPPPRHGGALPR
jgi:Protein of unknown function (DUF3306)